MSTRETENEVQEVGKDKRIKEGKKLRPTFSANGMTVLKERYLIKREDGTQETVEELLERVSGGNVDYYNLMASGDFLPNSPTLFNKGTGQGTLSACFKFDIPDTMEGIMDVATKAAMVLKFGGGVGYVFSEVRQKGALIKTTHGRACGPVSVMKHMQSVAEMITQGGKRAGAQMGILHWSHPDFKEFIHCKDENPEALNTFNISGAMTDEFMKKANEEPSSEEGQLLTEMANSAWRTGDPGVYFIDQAERTNPTPWLGKLTGTNPCGEVPLLDNEPCNLGSINLSHFVEDDKDKNRWGSWGYFNWTRLELTVRQAIRFLDDILDANTFPDPRITVAAQYTRKLGLGVMGWADALALMEIHYDSEEAVSLGTDLMKFINQVAREESAALANQKGPAPAFKEHEDFIHLEGEEWKRAIIDAGFWLRNATRSCIAPTGSIATINGASNGIEPHFALSNTRRMGSGTVLNEKVWVLEVLEERAKKENRDTFVPHTAMEIDWSWHIRHQAAFQKHTDLAVSKTINMPNSATPEAVRDAYLMMWAYGTKGGTIFRDGSRGFGNQVLVSSEGEQIVEEEKKREATRRGTEVKESGPENGENAISHLPRRKLPDDVKAIRHKFNVGELEGYLHVGLFDDGSPGELFVTTSRQGTTTEALMDCWAIGISMGLQYGVPLKSIVNKYSGTRFEPSGLTGNPLIPTASSPMDYIARWLGFTFLEGHVMPTDTGMFCPDCDSSLVAQEGCLKCSSPTCGWSRC
jgi:ribonucleoside-diphosphate reductase alpha chain